MSDSFLNVQKFLNKINTGYSNQQKISAARRQNLPDYVAESTLILLQDMVDTISKNEKNPQKNEQLFETVLLSCQGPLSSQHAKNDVFISELLQKFNLNPWLIKKGGISSTQFLEIIFEQNWPITLKTVITNPNTPTNWSKIPLFKHKIPLVHAAAMRKLDLLDMVLKIGGDPSELDKKNNILKRAASLEHLTLLLKDSRTHPYLPEYMKNLSEHRTDKNQAQKIELILASLSKNKSLKFFKECLFPFVDKITNQFLAHQDCWKIFDQYAAKNSLNFLTIAASKKTDPLFKFNDWPFLAFIAKDQFFKIRSERTVISPTYYSSFLTTQNTKWEDLISFENKTIPCGVWPALSIWGRSFATDKMGEALPKTSTAATLNRKKDISDFLPFMGKNPGLFWEGVIDVLKDLKKEQHWVKASVLVTLLTEPYWALLPEYDTYKPQLNMLFKEWVNQKESNKWVHQKETKDFPILTAFVSMNLDEMKADNTHPKIERLNSILKIMDNGNIKSTSVISFLDTYMNLGGELIWDEKLEGSYKKMLKSAGKKKDEISILEKWKLKSTLSKPQAEPVKKMRL